MWWRLASTRVATGTSGKMRSNLLSHPSGCTTRPDPSTARPRRRSHERLRPPKSASTRAKSERKVDPDIEARAKELSRQIDPEAILTENTLKLITEGRPGDQSELIYDICLGAVQFGLTSPGSSNSWRTPPTVVVSDLRQEIETNGPKRAIDWFAITWEAAQRHRATQLAMVDQLKEEVTHYEWPKTVRYRARLGDFHRVRSTSMKLVSGCRARTGLPVHDDRTDAEPEVDRGDDQEGHQDGSKSARWSRSARLVGA